MSFFDELRREFLEHTKRSDAYRKNIHRIPFAVLNAINAEFKVPAPYKLPDGGEESYTYLVVEDTDDGKEYLHYDEDTGDYFFSIGIRLDKVDNIFPKFPFILHFSMRADEFGVDLVTYGSLHRVDFSSPDESLPGIARSAGLALMKYLKSPYGSGERVPVGFGPR